MSGSRTGGAPVVRFRSRPVPSINWREHVENRPLGNRDEHVRAYRDQLEVLVLTPFDWWEDADEALWAAAPEAYRLGAYAAIQ